MKTNNNHSQFDASQEVTSLKPPRKPLKRWFRFRKSEEGTATIEFALVSIPFFLVLFAILEQGFTFLAHRLIDAGVYKISREIKTGQIRGGPGGMSMSQFRDKLCANPLMLMFKCNDLVIDVQTLASFDKPAGPPLLPNGKIDQSQLGFDPGGRSTINLVRVYYDWPTVLDWETFGQQFDFTGKKKIEGMGSNGYRRIVGSAAFLNEPY